jgi:hypothetical protein
MRPGLADGIDRPGLRRAPRPGAGQGRGLGRLREHPKCRVPNPKPCDPVSCSSRPSVSAMMRIGDCRKGHRSAGTGS